MTLRQFKKPDCIHPKNFIKNKIKYPCMAAIKMDGVRGRYIDGKLLTRTGHELVGLDHILEELNRFNITTEFDGELFVPGKKFDEISGLVRKESSTPEIKYYIFDIPSKMIPQTDRYLYLFENEKYFKDPLILAKYIQINNYDHLRRFYINVVELGHEGVVVYDPNTMYEDKKTYEWMKLVQEKTVDCPCVGFVPGQGKHTGRLGSIKIKYKNTTVSIGSGFSDSERQIIWDYQGKYLNRIAEIKYKNITEKGSLRQPRFKRWRWDK